MHTFGEWEKAEGKKKNLNSIWESYFITIQDLTFSLPVITENLLPLQHMAFLKSFIFFTNRNVQLRLWQWKSIKLSFFIFRSPRQHPKRWFMLHRGFRSPVLKPRVKLVPLHAQILPKAKENINTNVHQPSDSSLRPLSWLVDQQGQADI